jgi:hypothetical protein
MGLRSERAACRCCGDELTSWGPNPPTELAVGLARLTTALRRTRGGDSPPGPPGPMGPPLPAAGTSGIRQARHASTLWAGILRIWRAESADLQGALACRPGPWLKAVRASGSCTFKCSVLLALGRISSSPAAATSRSRRDKRSAPISSEKWASYSHAPPSGGPARRAGPGRAAAGRCVRGRTAAAGAGTGGPRGGWSTSDAWRFCAGAPGSPAAGSAGVAPLLPDGIEKAPYPWPLRLSARRSSVSGPAATGPCSTRGRFR